MIFDFGFYTFDQPNAWEPFNSQQSRLEKSTGNLRVFTSYGQYQRTVLLSRIFDFKIDF